MRKLILALALAACGTKTDTPFVTNNETVDCESLCGMLVVSPAPPNWCSELQDTETKVVLAFEKITNDARFSDPCPALNGWKIQVQPAHSWVSDDTGALVNGETRCGTKRILVGNELPAHGMLPHHMAHAVQNCTPLPPINPQDPAHSNWDQIEGQLWGSGFFP